MENWEDILAGYLEGMESRADAESLRWKIHLPAEVREEVEAVLRLADEVAAAIGSVSVPEGAVPRLQDALHAQPDWQSRPMPAGWQFASGEFESRRLGGVAVSAGSAAEDAVNAVIEGTAGSAGRTPDLADEELAGRLEQVRLLTVHLSDLARRRPPEGAVDRLLSRFREDVAAGSDEGGAEADEEAARQFLARIKTGAPRRPQLPARPDVLAASVQGADATPGTEPQGGDAGQKADPAAPGDPSEH